MGSGNSDSKMRAMSLFARIPINRSCSDAAIEAHWCACLTWVSMAINEDVREIVNAVIEQINKETERERKLCARLKLQTIKKARKAIATDALLRFQKSVDIDGLEAGFGEKIKMEDTEYQVTFQTTPGNMTYEATARYKSFKKKVIETNLKTVSILTAYGDRPHCVAEKDPSLRKWCICSDKI